MNASTIMAKPDYRVILGICNTPIYIKLSKSESQSSVMEASSLSKTDECLYWISLCIKTIKYTLNKLT